VTDHPVVNASPLILLARSDCFELLQVAGKELFVPASVSKEILQRGSSDITVQAMENATWLRIVDDLPTPNNILSWDLGPGESSVLAWALAHPGTEAILDDRPARRCAAVLEIPVCGTLGLILRAKRKGIINKARPVLEKIHASGMYLSSDLINEVLSLVEE
jgi:predicted nucleic acid-binding protein